MASAGKKKQATMTAFFKPMEPQKTQQTLLTKFFKSTNENENKFEYLFQREEARRKKLEDDAATKLKLQKQEERRQRKEEREKLREIEKKDFEEDQKRRWEEENFKREGHLIVPGLYLGSRLAAKNYEWLNGHVTHILNVSEEVKNYCEGQFVTSLVATSNDEETQSKDESEPKEGEPKANAVSLQYKRILVQDAIDAPLHTFFEEITAFVHRAITEEKGAVLIHCREGLSRSPTSVIAYLMKYHGWTLKKSFDHVLECNSKLRVNDGFKRQLMAFEKTLFPEGSVDFFDRRTRGGTARTTSTLAQIRKTRKARLVKTTETEENEEQIEAESTMDNSVCDIEMTDNAQETPDQRDQKENVDDANLPPQRTPTEVSCSPPSELLEQSDDAMSIV